MEEDIKIKALFPNNVETIVIRKDDYDRLCGDLTYENITLKERLEQLEKENKELKEAWRRQYEENVKTVLEKYTPKIFLEIDYIPKSKIEDKIKELEKYMQEDEYENYDNEIEILKELLEGN